MSDEQPPSKEWTYKRLARVAINSLPVPACLEMAKQLETIFSSLERAHDSSKDEVWSDARILDELGDYDACLSPEHVKRLFENAHRLLQHLRRENVRWENAHKILLADNERLRKQVTELSIHAEKWVKRALGGAAPEPPAESVTVSTPVDWDAVRPINVTFRSTDGEQVWPPGDGK